MKVGCPLWGLVVEEGGECCHWQLGVLYDHEEEHMAEVGCTEDDEWVGEEVQVVNGPGDSK